MITVRLRQASLVVCLVIAACGGGGGNNNTSMMNGDGGVDAGMLPDDGPCTPMALRCNGNTVEQCSDDGSHWVPGMVCTTFCQDGTCALDGLDVASDMTLEGTVVVSGAVTVHAGATLSSALGDLTIEADSITVETGGSISTAATGKTPDGAGQGATGGSYGTGNRTFGSTTDATVQAGAQGGSGQEDDVTTLAFGGGALRLIAKTAISIAGQITANGANGLPDPEFCAEGGGGGSGGGILIVGDSITITGTVSAAGGLGGPGFGTTCSAIGLAGGGGRVKILFGSHIDVTGSTIVGSLTKALAPPIPLSSTSHPDATAIYNDGFLSLDMQWNKAFPSVMGYFSLLDTSPSNPPTAADGTFLSVNKVSFQSSDVANGVNYVHVVSVDAQSAISTVENTFKVSINTQPPSVASASHPTQTQFVANTNPDFTWSYPQGDSQVTNAYYVFDHFGLTIPAITDTKLPASQKQLLQTDVPAGVWVLHVVSADSQGRLTKLAGHFRVNIGTDPGEGPLSGLISDSTSQSVIGATVTINRGLFTATTQSNGQYSFNSVIPAGTWELTATMGALTATKMITIVAGQPNTGNLTIQ
jgi:hypothetical protein